MMKGFIDCSSNELDKPDYSAVDAMCPGFGSFAGEIFHSVSNRVDAQGRKHGWGHYTLLSAAQSRSSPTGGSLKIPLMNFGVHRAADIELHALGFE